jgi:RNA polymerase sigma-70 factor, ECF subfamily
LPSYKYKTRLILTEHQLIEECRGGNFTNFSKLVRLSAPFAFSVAFRMVGDEDNANDIVQETMVAVWQKIGKIRSAEAYRTWVYRIVLNKCYDQLRRSKNNQEVSADEKTWNHLSEVVSGVNSTPLENEDSARILGMLTKRLSPNQKAVFILSEIEEMSHDEIAEITGMSKTIIKANLYHARKNISEMVEKYL